MSDSHKHYDYFKVEGTAVKELIDAFADIGKKRDAVIKEVMNEFGAIAYTNSSGFGDKGNKLRSLAWEFGYQFPCAVTIKSTDYFEDKKVVIARGKGNSKEGKEFNKRLDAAIKAANAKLEAFPVWQSYIIEHYKIMKTGFGEATGRGIPMLTTYGGRHPLQDDCLIFAVPNTKDKEGYAKHGDVEIPDEFVQLTYGQFYDIANSKAA